MIRCFLLFMCNLSYFMFCCCVCTFSFSNQCPRGFYFFYDYVYNPAFLETLIFYEIQVQGGRRKPPTIANRIKHFLHCRVIQHNDSWIHDVFKKVHHFEHFHLEDVEILVFFLQKSGISTLYHAHVSVFRLVFRI